MRITLPSKLRAILFATLILPVIPFLVLGQGGDETTKPTTPIKFDVIGPIGDCELGGRFDRFQRELSDKPDHQGYVINYSSMSNSDEVDVIHRERIFTERVAFRNFDRSRITLVRGGYRLEEATELWLIPPGSDNPAPSDTVSGPRQSSRNSSVLYASNYLEYYNDDLLKDFSIAVKPDDPKTSEGDSADEESGDAEHRYRWADPGFAVRVANTKGSAGLILFYADDKRYDIRKLRTLIESGARRASREASLAGSRIRIEFGGYRTTPTAELWLVPENGEPPKARPSARCNSEG